MKMGDYIIKRERRKSKIIDENAKKFADCVHEGNYIEASAIAVHTALETGGVKGIIRAIKKANSFIQRKSLRKHVEGGN